MRYTIDAGYEKHYNIKIYGIMFNFNLLKLNPVTECK